MSMILALLIYTAIAAFSPQLIPGIRVRGWGAAFGVALVFGILNFLIGWLILLVFKAITLPFLLITGFSFILQVVVNALLLKVTDAILEPFEMRGWQEAFIMALLFAIGGLIAGMI